MARTDLPGKNLNEKASAYMIVRELGERGSSSSSEESCVLACAIIFFFGFFVETRSIVTLANLPRNDWHFSPCTCSRFLLSTLSDKKIDCLCILNALLQVNQISKKKNGFAKIGPKSCIMILLKSQLSEANIIENCGKAFKQYAA